MTDILLTGKNSFLAQGLLALPDSAQAITAVSHGQIDDVDFRRFRTVVNMAGNPLFMRETYSETLDVDLAIARRAAAAGAHYVMLSTRKVYGPEAPFPATEEAPCRPQDAYGRNKLHSEGVIRELLPGRCTILRVANVFGFEPGRRSFFGLALDRLKRENRIVLDVSPTVRRDFLHVADFAKILHHVLKVTPTGTYNLGSGQATELGDIARWLIEGFGGGDLVIESGRIYDNFLLDCTKLTAATGFHDTFSDIRGRCRDIGRMLTSA